MGIAILLVEQHEGHHGVCERIVVLNYGAKIAEGTLPRSPEPGRDPGLPGEELRCSS